MGIGTAGGLAIGAGLSAAGSLGGAAIQANAAGNAANAQTRAANFAAELQAEEAQQGLSLEAGQYNNSQQEISPFLQGGTSALVNLENLLGILPSSAYSQNLYSPQPLSVPSINFPGTNNPISSGTVGGGPLYNQTGHPQSALAGRTPSPPIQPGAGINAGSPGFGGSVGFGGPTATPVIGGTAQIPSVGGNAFSPPSGLNQSRPITRNPGQGTARTGISPSGTQTLGSLVNPSLGATGSLMQPWTQQFQAPSLQQAQQYPGYQFQLQQGLSALQNSAAAQGGLLSGNTGEALTNYAQNAAQSDYTNVYNQALNQYQMSYNQFQQNQANQYNRLASLAGLGQVSAGQLSSAGLSSGGSIANLLAEAGGQIGQSAQNAGAATASGYIGGANAYGGALGNSTSNLGQLLSLYSLLGGQGSNVLGGAGSTPGFIPGTTD